MIKIIVNCVHSYVTYHLQSKIEVINLNRCYTDLLSVSLNQCRHWYPSTWPV